jgi:hypothetical protein
MADVLHIGPYPARDPDVVPMIESTVVNFMQHPLASRIGLAAAERFWPRARG